MADVLENTAPAPAASTTAEGDALLDQLLEQEEVSQAREDTASKPKKEQRKPSEPARPEKETVEDEEAELSMKDALDTLEETEDTDREDDTKDEEEDQSPESEQGRFVAKDGRVRLDDGTVTTVAELVRGNLREADYTRKTQEVGALHSELQSKLADYAQQEQLVSLAVNVMAAALPPEPDPVMLQPGENYDPVGYTSQKMLWEHAAGQLNGFVQAQQAMMAKHKENQGVLLQKYATEQRDQLLADIPELKDKQKLEAFNGDLIKTLARYGKGPDDLAEVYDAKIILMLKHLSSYWKIMGERKRARAKAHGAPVLPPNTRQSPSGQKARAKQADWDTLRKTGSHGSGGEAALDRILDDLL